MFVHGSFCLRVLVSLVFSAATVFASTFPVTDYGAVPGDDKPDIQAFQKAIDAAAKAGGGVVRVPEGAYLCGALSLKSNMVLHLEKGAVLKGSKNFRDYGRGRWADALVTGRKLVNIRIEGEGVIDGADCRNPKGEEGFRGPHGIFLSECRGITIKGITLKRTGNYAVLCRNCSDATMQNVTMRGGHDGLHAQACRRFTVTGCDVRTGDDCFAGCDNVDVKITGCKINSSCNGFRLGCKNLEVTKCRFWGPGEYQHKVSKRNNMLSAFVHFAPRDRNPKLPSDNWLIRDITVDNVDAFYTYDIEKGVWQRGQPAKKLVFENVTAKRVGQPIRVLGDAERRFELFLKNVTISLRKDRAEQAVLLINRFGALNLENVTFHASGKKPVIEARNGNKVVLQNVKCVPRPEVPFVFSNIDEVKK